jgi:hypothetical protein
VTLDLAVPSSIERPAELMKGLFETHLNVANLNRL